MYRLITAGASLAYHTSAVDDCSRGGYNAIVSSRQRAFSRVVDAMRAIVERLLRDNENRGKTPMQQIREGMAWEPIETHKAEKQRLANLKHSGNSIDLQNFAGRESGNVRDIIARRVGLGSGVTYEKGKAVVETIDRELAVGDFRERGRLLRIKLNEESINAASKLMQNFNLCV
jgi:hypothetical protein